VIVAILAFRLVVGFVTGLLWMVALVALVAGGLWARSKLKAAQRRRELDREARPAIPASHEDRVAAEMRRINEQLRDRRR
jgi:hypothetical protein